MNKKSILKKANDIAKKRGMNPYSGILIGRIDPKYKGVDAFVITDGAGNPVDIIEGKTSHQMYLFKQDREAFVNKLSLDKETDKKFNELLVKEKAKAKLKKDMTRQELKTLKEDPSELRAKLDKAYLAYDEANAKVEDVIEEGSAEDRLARTKKRIAMKKLYDTATATGSITGEDEKGKAFSYVTGESIKEGISTGELPVEEGEYRTKKDPRRPTDVLESLDTPSSTLGVLQKPTELKKLSDEELIKRLQLGK